MRFDDGVEDLLRLALQLYCDGNQVPFVNGVPMVSICRTGHGRGGVAAQGLRETEQA